MSRLAVILPLLLLHSGCAALARQATTRFAEDLSNAILDQNDAATVRDGAPAYLLAMDGLIEGDPESATLLLSGARLYGSYASAFVDDDARVRRLWDRALGYGRRALCVEMPEPCGALDGPYDDFAASLSSVERQDVPTLYGFGVAWAGWVQANAGDWGAVAQIPKIQALMERVVALDESYDHGSAHLYLGVLLTLRPDSQIVLQHDTLAIEHEAKLRIRHKPVQYGIHRVDQACTKGLESAIPFPIPVRMTDLEDGINHDCL